MLQETKLNDNNNQYSVLQAIINIQTYFWLHSGTNYFLSCVFQALIPNTKHNAVFLRDNPKAAKVILISPFRNEEYFRAEIKSNANKNLIGDQSLKKFLYLAEKHNTNLEVQTDADRWAVILAN